MLVDDFDNGNANGWAAYGTTGGSTPKANGVEVRTTDRCHGFTNNVLALDIGGDVDLNDWLKKVYDLTGIPHTKVKVVYTLYACGDWSKYKFVGNDYDRDRLVCSFGTGLSLTNDGDIYPVLEDTEPQITRELILTTSSNSFGIGFRGDLVGDDFPFPKFYYWAIDNIEVWVK